MSTPRGRPVLEATLEAGEAVVDAIMQGDALADVPVIGTAFKIAKAADSIRDRVLAAKLTKFVTEAESMPKASRERLKAKIAESPQEASHVGETLFLVIDRITDLEKPAMLALLFIAFIDDVLTSEELRRLCQAVDAGFADDLISLLKAHNVPEKSDVPWMKFLAPTGLTESQAQVGWGADGTILYDVSKLGNKFRTAYFHGRNRTRATTK